MVAKPVALCCLGERRSISVSSIRTQRH